MYTLTTVAEASQAKAEAFEQIVRPVHPWFEAMCSQLDVTDVHVTAVLADDFIGAVTRAIAKSDSVSETRKPFTVERLAGGVVAAKNIPLRDDWSEVHVIFDASQVGIETAQTHAKSLYVAAHEFTHALVGRLRHVAGCSVQRQDPTRHQTPFEAARLIMRQALDEWRADFIANVVLSKTVTVGTNESDRRGAGGPDVEAGGFIGQLGAVLDLVVHPGWPDIVWSYRTRKIDLMAMWNALLGQAEDTFIFLGHAQAEAEHYSAVSPFIGEVATHPGAALYLEPVWDELRDAVKDHTLLTGRDAFRDSEPQIVERAGDALIAMWGRLGLTFEVKPDQSFAIWVRDPQR